VASTTRKPWISPETIVLADKKRHLKQRRHESKSMESEYRKLCNQVRKAARQDKDHWLRQQCEDIQQSYEENKSRKTFRLIKDINRQWQPRQLTAKNKREKILQSKEEVMERWTEYCSKLYKDKDSISPMIAELEKFEQYMEAEFHSVNSVDVATNVQFREFLFCHFLAPFVVTW